MQNDQKTGGQSYDMIPEREPCPNVFMQSPLKTYCTYFCGRLNPNIYRVVEIFLDRLKKKKRKEKKEGKNKKINDRSSISR